MKRYLAFTWIRFQTGIVYRANILMYSLGTAVEILVMAAIWGVIYRDGFTVNGVGVRGMITYSVIVMILDNVFSRWGLFQTVVEKIRTGNIALELTRPVRFHLNALFQTIGDAAYQSVFIALPFFLLGMLIFNISLPPDFLSFLLFLVSAGLAFLISFEIFYFFDLSMFFTIESFGIIAPFMGIVNLFSGLLVPLWLFPGWLRAAAEILPFKGMYYIPASIYLGLFRGAEILPLLGFQLIWLGILIILSEALWSVAVRRIVIQGG